MKYYNYNKKKASLYFYLWIISVLKSTDECPEPTNGTGYPSSSVGFRVPGICAQP